MSRSVFIPALKKSVAFQDDLVKKLNGVTPVQRAINAAVKLGVATENIQLITDSEEISLIGERNMISVFQDPLLKWDSKHLHKKILGYIVQTSETSDVVIILSPYAPLINTELLEQAIADLLESNKDILKPTKLVGQTLYSGENVTLDNIILGNKAQNHEVESNAFTIIKRDSLAKKRKKVFSILPWQLDHDFLEIKTYQDWWVCEKLLQRKRIVFRVIGNNNVGMGHIYRSLSLAHDITDHEVIFVTDNDNEVAVTNIAGYDYKIDIFETGEIVDRIIDLRPDLLINDILSTTYSDMKKLCKAGIRTLNFEDLGSGAKESNVTINELFDEPLLKHENILWGHDYFFLRDEFLEATPRKYHRKIESILLLFGGTDLHNLSSYIFNTIKDICADYGINIYIVTGPGYKAFSSLEKETFKFDNVHLTHATGIISSIMEKCDFAITSNGRTVYELAHMNIPAIVIPQNEREVTHSFASLENGFLSVDMFNREKTGEEVRSCLEKILKNGKVRQTLYAKIRKYDFRDNKSKIMKTIQQLIDD
jgi:spore coat polysaccharide biosynthesis predicted glycosyltransferase SpsG/CMP-N-acetylneuraminic acid synthetase